MEMMLVVLTLIAAGAAFFFAATAARLTRAERQRSAARVAMLASAIDQPSVQSGTSRVDLPTLFARRDATDVPGRPFIKAAVVVAMAVVAVVALGSQWRTSGNATAMDVDRPQATAKSTSAPIELMSMRHARDNRGLTVTGLVRNPAGGAHVEGVSAVVLTFDRNGTFITSSRAPIDFVSLDPGDESPFVVTIPRAGDVGRYRVTFRSGSGIIRHIDRRGEPTLAAHSGQ